MGGGASKSTASRANADAIFDEIDAASGANRTNRSMSDE